MVMGICGTYTLKSANGRMLEIVGEKLESHGIDWVVWNNEDSPLPFVGEDGCWDHPNVKKYKDIADSVDAFVLSSPEYHGTMSGVMKNSLDWLSFNQTSGKIFRLYQYLGRTIKYYYSESYENCSSMDSWFFNTRANSNS